MPSALALIGGGGEVPGGRLRTADRRTPAMSRHAKQKLPMKSEIRKELRTTQS